MMKKLMGPAVLLSAALVAASGARAAGVSDKEIVLGTHLDLSGPVAAGMPSIRNGMQMRIDEANEAGGVNGRRLKLIIEDNAGQPAQAVRVVQKLLRKDEVFAIINAFGSGANAATIKAVAEAGVVNFAPWGASGAFQAISGRHPLLFTTVPNYDSTTAIGLSWAIKNWNTRKVGVIYQEGPLGDLVRRGVKSALDTAGLQPVAEASYKAGDIDFSSQVARMKNAGADLVVLATITRETIGVMAEVKKLGWKEVKVLANIPGRTQIVAALGKDAVEGLYGIGGWKLYYPDNAPDSVKKWVESYKKRFNADPDENSMVAYSYTDWFMKGVQGAGRTLSAESLAKALQSVGQEDFMTYRKIGFKGNHADPEVVEIDQIKNGRWVSVSQQMTEVVK